MKTPSGLQPLIDDGVIDEVLRSLKSGKEATVYLVRSGSQVRCAKDREQYRIFGIDPESVSILVCKGINHFRADFEPIARELIFVDTGGLVP
jgi:microcystin degradation protein MlrC